MRYKVVYMPDPRPPHELEWFDTKLQAWEYTANMKCGFGTNEICEMCQAEWDVFGEDELDNIESKD